MTTTYDHQAQKKVNSPVSVWVFNLSQVVGNFLVDQNLWRMFLPDPSLPVPTWVLVLQHPRWIFLVEMVLRRWDTSISGQCLLSLVGVLLWGALWVIIANLIPTITGFNKNIFGHSLLIQSPPPPIPYTIPGKMHMIIYYQYL